MRIHEPNRPPTNAINNDLIDIQKVYPYEQNDEVYINVFLIDDSINGLGWGVTPESIPANIKTAIGQPVVAFLNANGIPDHPDLRGEPTVEHAEQYQNLFAIGRFEEVYESNKHPGRWYGIAKITDPDAKQAFRENPTKPIFVSPTIHADDPYEPDWAVSKWKFMHSAIVDVPAFGVSKAYVTGSCNGSKDTCALRLMQASMQKAVETGKHPGCGCAYETVKMLQASVDQKLKTGDPNKIFSSHGYSTQQVLSDKGLNTENQTVANNVNPNASNSSVATGVNNSGQEQQQQVQQQQQQPKSELVTNTYAQLQKEIEKLQNEIGSKNKEQNTDNEGKKGKADKNGNKKSSEQEGQEDNNNKDNENNNKNNKEDEEATARISPKDVAALVVKNETLVKDNTILSTELETARRQNQALLNLVNQLKDINNQLESEKQQAAQEQYLTQVRDIVFKAPAYRDLNDKQKEEQVKVLADTKLEIEHLNKLLQPVNLQIKKASMQRGYVPRVPLTNDVMIENATEIPSNISALRAGAEQQTQGQTGTDPNYKSASMRSTRGSMDEPSGSIALAIEMGLV